jgi:2-polyprenyl-6-methoxyphenol hydroxylase-like FAD-dependent oxidoreductase
MGRTAAIVGGGIGGLATAIGLRQAGWDVTVFEREAGPSGSGTALGIWPSATRALDALGLGDHLRRTGTRQNAGQFRRPNGSRIGALDVRKLERRSGDPVYLVSRPALLSMLRAAVGEETVRFASPVDGIAALRQHYDVVVGADGIASRARAELFGDGYRARYTGSTAWRGWVDGMATDTVTETWGRGSKFGLTPQEGGRTNWYATTRVPEASFTPGTELATLRRMFGAWPEPIPQILDRLTETDILRHDLYVVPKLPTFVRQNVALVGDAAHAMTPDLGRGACEALIDGVTLAQSLRDAPNTSAGLLGYDRKRRRAVQRLGSASSAAAGLTRWRGGLWLRDALLRVSLRLPMAD